MAIEVKLPVCPVCGNVGKIPGPQSMSLKCRGGKGKLHKIRAMKYRVFREVPEQEGSGNG